MATIEALAKKRAESIVLANDSISAIVEQLNHFVESDKRLTVIELPLGVNRHGDPFATEVSNLTRLADFLQSVALTIDSLLETVDANKRLADELIELQAKLNEAGKSEIPDDPKIDPDSEVEKLNETESQEDESEIDPDESDESESEKADNPPQHRNKRGRPKK